VNSTRQFKSWLARYGVGTVLAVGLGLVLLEVDTLKPKLVDPSYDVPFLGRPTQAPGEVVMVCLDEDSHRELNQPYNASWDRALYSQLVERLTAEHARAVVFDMLFTDPHPTKPAGDERFARAIKANGNVILGAEYTLTADGSPTIMRAIDQFLDPAADWGFVQLQTDQDFIVRRHLHVPPDPDAENFSSLTWQAAHWLGSPATRKPENRDRERWMNYYGPPGTIPEISFYRALEPNESCPAGYFSNKVVFVGGTLKTHFSGERKDEYRTPYTEKGQFVPGLEVQATQFLNLMRGDWLTRFSPRAEVLLVLASGLVFGMGLARFRPLPAIGLALLGAGLVTGGAYYLFWGQRIWFPWLVTVAAQIPMALLWSIVYNSVASHIQNRLLEQSLGLYLSPKQVQRILKEPGLRQPGGSKQVASILFSDIAGFSRISEQLDPADLVLLLNSYYETTIRAIHQTEGTIVDIIGDAIFAIWNAPELQPDHQARMLQAALLFQQNVKQFNGKQGSFALRTRVGLHTGEVVVGNVGSSEHFDYAAIGENVNLASRLEGLNKQLGTDVLMTRAAIPATTGPGVLRAVGKFRFKGLAQVVEVVECVILPGAGEAAQPWLEAFGTALAHLQQRRFAEAETAFRQTLELRAGDGPSTFYLQHLQELRSQTLPDDWAGEINLTEK
jgi:adenylate cyclase